MSERLAAPRRFRGIRKQISLFLITAVVGLVGVIGLIAYKQGMFVRHVDIYFYAADAHGINKGMSVRLYGLPVGAVKDFELSDRGVKVRLAINSDYIDRLPRGSQARLMREGYVGAASIQIVTGTTPGMMVEPVSEGEEIKFVPQRGMVEMVDEFRLMVSPAIDELRKAIAEVRDPGSDFRKSAAAAREVLEQLPETNRELRQLMRNADRSVIAVGKQAEATGRQAEAALAAVERLSTQTEQHLPVLAGKLATTLDSLNSAATQVRDTTRTSGEALRELLVQAPAVVRGSGELLRDGQEIVGAARRTWLLRDYIEPSQMRTLPVDSFESFGKR